MRETVAFTTQMPDAGYLMLDIQKCSNSAIQKHPVSGNQYPVSARNGHGLCPPNLDCLQTSMQLTRATPATQSAKTFVTVHGARQTYDRRGFLTPQIHSAGQECPAYREAVTSLLMRV
jgi:hypothetical protein